MKNAKGISKAKRAVLTTMAALCAFSSVSIVANAATGGSSTRTLSVSDEIGSYATRHYVTMDKAGYFAETFPSYPKVTGTYWDKTDKVYKSYARSENKSYCCLSNNNHTVNSNSYILNKNSAEHKSLLYYGLSKNTSYYIDHKHTKKGGFTCKVTSTRYYN